MPDQKVSENNFNNVAFSYDRTFTNTKIGRLQRNHVHQYLEKIIRQGATGEVLELNAGTGEDALFFARKGWQVLATDISREMVKVGTLKAKANRLESLVSFKICDVRKLSDLRVNNKFDLIFSNFGGLNCLNPEELKRLSYQIASLLKPHGRFIAVIMPKFCFWENTYYLLKFKPKTAFRRNTKNPVFVQVGNATVETRYFSPAEFSAAFRPVFHRIGLQPVGLFIPPSYMETWFGNKPRMLGFLDILENRLNKIPAFANFSDHFLIEFQPSQP